MQPGLQEWIHKMELGAGTRYVKIGLLVLGFLTLAFRYDISNYKAFGTAEAMDGAQLGRNIALGRGYTTRFVRPITLALLQTVQGDNQPVLKKEQPDLSNPPAYPLILAGLFKALPFEYSIGTRNPYAKYQPELFIAVFNQCLFALAIVQFFFLARRIFDDTVAIVSAVIFAASDLLWKFSVSGLSTIWLLNLFLGLIWCLVLLEEASEVPVPGPEMKPVRSEAWFVMVSIGLGVLLGLGALTRYGYGWLAIPVAAYALFFMGKRRGMVCAVVLFVFLMILSPWCYRNYQLSGRLFGTAGFAIYEQTSYFSGARLERAMPRNIEAELNKTSLRDFTHKFLVQAGQIVRNEVGQIGGNWLCTGLFLTGLLIPFRNPLLTRVRLFGLVSLAVLIAVQAMGYTHLSIDSPQVNTENLLVFIMPLIIMYGVAMFFTLLELLSWPHPTVRIVAIVSFTLIASIQLIFTMLPPRSIPASAPYSPPLTQMVGRWMNNDELMMSDMPWAVAWYGDRQCIWTTLDSGTDHSGDFFTINDYQKQIHGLYLTPLTIDTRFVTEMIRSSEGAWGRFVLESVLHTNVPTGFPLKNAPKGFLPDFLFLSDRVRWTKDLKQ